MTFKDLHVDKLKTIYQTAEFSLLLHNCLRVSHICVKIQQEKILRVNLSTSSRASLNCFNVVKFKRFCPFLIVNKAHPSSQNSTVIPIVLVAPVHGVHPHNLIFNRSYVRRRMGVTNHVFCATTVQDYNFVLLK